MIDRFVSSTSGDAAGANFPVLLDNIPVEDLETCCLALMIADGLYPQQPSEWPQHWRWFLEFRGQGGSADHSNHARAERMVRAVLSAWFVRQDQQQAAGANAPIPELGMTFAEAMAKIASLIEEDGKSDPEDYSVTDQWVDLRMQVLKAEPRSLADVLVQLDLLLDSEIELDLPSFVKQALENVRALLKRWRVGDATQPANDESFNPFAGAIAAFEAEAPVTLSVPQQPTGRMVEAGANAAGITTQQFETAYAAAVEALKQERAA